MLAYDFCNMGMWLLNQDIAHGDLKPDNILVRDDGSLILVDYDGMFVPSMQGKSAAELGTPDFRHPLRTAEQFNAHIDDFSIATIALSLRAIALNPALWSAFHSQDRLLFGCNDYLKPGESPLLREILTLSNDQPLSRLFGLFKVALSTQQLDLASYRLLQLDKPERKGCKKINKQVVIQPKAFNNTIVKDNGDVVTYSDHTGILEGVKALTGGVLFADTIRVALQRETGKEYLEAADSTVFIDDKILKEFLTEFSTKPLKTFAHKYRMYKATKRFVADGHTFVYWQIYASKVRYTNRR